MLSTWVKSCRTKLPALLADHVSEYACSEKCKECNADLAERGKHTYEEEDAYKCIEKCGVCGASNPDPAEHKAYTTCGAVCQFCHATIGKETLHQYSTVCDTTCDCGYQRTTGAHVYDSVCDEKCNICHAAREATVHVFDNDCDRVCNNEGCAVIRSPKHTYASDCDADCDVCGEKREAAHVFGEYVVTKAATKLKNGEQERTCTVCGHKESAPIARYGVAIWVIVLSGVGAGSVLFVGGFSLYWFVIKKRTLAQFFGKESAKKGGKKSDKKKKS